jgi:hypothetical protein
MSRRHAPTDRPPSTAGTFLERATRRPARVGVIVATAFALGGPMVAAQPVAAPRPAPVEAGAVAAAVAARPVARPGEGPLSAIGQVVRLAATDSTSRAEASATYLSASILAARDRAADEARLAAEEEAARRAAEEAAIRQAAADAARARAEAEAAARPPAPAVSNGSAWDALAACESGGNWSINTGNGYYGGLQFSLASWRGVGGSGYPHEASRETQIAMGERLRASGGWGHWPACSRKLGLR